LLASEIHICHVLGSIVISVILIPALLALKRIPTWAIIVMDICHAVEDVFHVLVFLSAHSFKRAMHLPRATLLEVATHALKLSSLGVEFTSREKAGCAGDSDFVDAEVNAENRSVLGHLFFGVLLGFAEAKAPDVLS